MNRSTLWAGAAVLLCTGPVLANDSVMQLESDAKQWGMQLGNYAGQRYSTLDAINKENVGDLQVAWTFSTGVLRGHEGSPLVIGDVMYVHTPFPNLVYALDLNDEGRIIWKYAPRRIRTSSESCAATPSTAASPTRRHHLPAPGRHQRSSRSTRRPAR